MRIGIYSGSFNPIHRGHTLLAQYMLEHTELDEVWLLVSPNNPLKPAESLLDEAVRYRLASLATEGMTGVRASNFEFTLPRPSFTVSTLAALQKAFPEHQFALIIGSDNMAIFDKWRDYQLILRTYPIYVYPREGDDMSVLCARYPEMQVVEGAPLLPISATQIRELLSATQMPDQLSATQMPDQLSASHEETPFSALHEETPFSASGTPNGQNMASESLLDAWLHPAVKDFLKKNTKLFAYIN